MVGRLEGKLRWVREKWGAVDNKLKRAFEKLDEEDEIKRMFYSKKRRFEYILNTENIYDEAEDDENSSNWLLDESIL